MLRLEQQNSLHYKGFKQAFSQQPHCDNKCISLDATGLAPMLVDFLDTIPLQDARYSRQTASP